MMTFQKKFELIVFGLVFIVCSVIVVTATLSLDRQGKEAPSRVPWQTSSSVEKSLIEATYVVSKVLDGDTIDVKDADGKVERVRLVGIDTPETVDPKKKVQCFGPEASAYLKNMLLGKSVTLEEKPDEDRDDYDRLLRYVYLDSEDVGSTMLAKGYAVSLCKSFPHPKCEEYDQLEEKAMSEKLGRWGACSK